MSIIGIDEDMPVTERHDIYPAIDPAVHYTAQTFKDKVVLVTGASKGIGQETAIQFARAGANLVLIARKQETLDETKAAILKHSADAQVLTFIADVKDTARAEAAIKATIAKFGRLDVLVANAGAVRAVDKTFTEKDPYGWWNIFEVNLRGTYNYVHYAIPELKKTKGTIIATNTRMAQLRIPFSSEYATSKWALNRFIEFVAIEHPEIPSFSVHPGTIESETNTEAGPQFAPQDKVGLPAATYLYLAAGNAPWLSGRYVSATWDLGEAETWKKKVVMTHGLVGKLSIPA